MHFNPVYFIREVRINTQRNPLMNIASISTVLILAVILGIFLLIVWNLNNVSQTLVTQLQITARLQKKLNPTQINSIKKQVSQIPNVDKVNFISKNLALKRLETRLKTQINLTHLKTNPLPDYFEIKVTDPQKIKITADEISQIKGIEKVKYGEYVTEKILVLSKTIQWAGVFIIILLIIATILIISNTIRLTVFARSEEIKIMQLVGAANWFIRWPFIIEGVLQGFIGTIIAVIILSLVYPVLAHQVQVQLPFLPVLLNIKLLLRLALNLIIIGILIGGIGSFISVNKFLHL